MLKKLLIVISLCFILCACRPISVAETKQSKNFSILSYNGTPSLSLLSITNDNYDIKITNTVDSIRFSMSKADKDFVIAPIDAGVRYSQEYDNYKLLAIVEYGTLSLATTNIESNSMRVAAYGQDSIVGKLVDFLKDTTFLDYEIIWYSSLDELNDSLLNEDTDCAILDEVNFNNINNYLGLEMIRIRDLIDDYVLLTGCNRYPMYGLFVCNDTLNNNQNEVIDFSKKISNSIITYKNDKTTFNQVLKNADLNKMGFSNSKLISESYNYCGLDYVYANKDIESLKAILHICGVDFDEKIVVQ